MMNSNVKKGLKITGISILLLVELLLLVVLSYVAYLSAGYYRVKDNQALAIENNKTNLVQYGTSYSISTYNIGFGAYSQDFDFFMDTGTLNGETITGTHSRAKDEKTVKENINGAIQTIKTLDTDFSFFQEVDVGADRSYFVDQYEMINLAFSEDSANPEFEAYSSSYASNFHTNYLMYPFNEPIGSIESGIVTMSRYEIESSTRRSFPIDEGFINKFFDLDRCFVVNRLNIEGSDKQLVLINLHMSAYDEGGVYRKQQLELLTNFMKSEYEKGNYVIAGGDRNNDIADSINTFPTQQEVPEWVRTIGDDEIPEGLHFVECKDEPTCRSAEMAYTEGVNYTVVIDGFLVSNNVQIDSIQNIDTDFLYSDHNPVEMKFTLIEAVEMPENPEVPEV